MDNQTPINQPVPEAAPNWMLSEEGLEAIRCTQAKRKMKHGLAAAVPIVCMGKDCPVAKTCGIKTKERPVGMRCPIEIGTIIQRFNDYSLAFGIADDDIIGLSLVRELADLDVLELRADNRMAIEAGSIETSVSIVDPDTGIKSRHAEPSPTAVYKARFRKERLRIIRLLNATR